MARLTSSFPCPPQTAEAPARGLAGCSPRGRVVWSGLLVWLLVMAWQGGFDETGRDRQVSCLGFPGGEAETSRLQVVSKCPSLSTRLDGNDFALICHSFFVLFAGAPLFSSPARHAIAKSAGVRHGSIRFGRAAGEEGGERTRSCPGCPTGSSGPASDVPDFLDWGYWGGGTQIARRSDACRQHSRRKYRRLRSTFGSSVPDDLLGFNPQSIPVGDVIGSPVWDGDVVILVVSKFGRLGFTGPISGSHACGW